MRSINIKLIMSSSVVTVGENDSLATVREIFLHAGFHHLLVTKDEALLGVISDRDLLRSVSPNLDTEAETLEDMAALNRRAHEIMSSSLIVLTPECTIGDAVDLFNQHPISCLPVVNAENKPVGIVSWRDILRAIPDDDSG